MAKRNAHWTSEQLAEIKRIQRTSGVSRKTAIRKMQAAAKEQAKAAKKSANKRLAHDVKMAAANDPSELNVRAQAEQTAAAAKSKNNADAKKPAKPKAEPKTPLPPSVVSANRREGLRLFALAGKPKKQDFVTVYGDKGDRWTWEQRAKAVGLATAEEAAEEFPSMLAAKSGATTTTATTAAPQKAAKNA